MPLRSVRRYTRSRRAGAALFTRTQRSVVLTEVGKRFLLRANLAFAELVAASKDARDLGQRPAGLLRLAVLPRWCRSYSIGTSYPFAKPDLVDIAAEGFDAVVRMAQFIATDMIAVRLTPPFPFAVVDIELTVCATASGRNRIEGLRRHNRLCRRWRGKELSSQRGNRDFDA
jgi:DNA-binding transcriptional LysR family regulator